MPKVSVIIPCYNQAQYLPEAVESVINQTFTDWECIIVNDGSPDNTEEVALQLCQRDSRIRYFKKENGGPSSARNFGIERAMGEYILPLDADDIIDKTFIEKALKFIGYYDVVFSKVKIFGLKDEIWQSEEVRLPEILIRNQVPSTALFRKTDWERAGGYNVNMKEGFEDWDFWLCFVEMGLKFYQVPEVLFFYRYLENSRGQLLDSNLVYALKKQLALNHLNLYVTYLGDPFSLYLKIKDLERQIDLIKNSWAYRIGNIIVTPFKKIINLFKNG